MYNDDYEENLKFLDFAGLCWPSLAFLALDNFFKQKMAFAGKNQALLTCFQQSDLKINFRR